MTAVTENFAVEEFACHDGTPYPSEWIEPWLLPLCQLLEVIRAKAGGGPMMVDSGYRTEEYDRRIYERHMAALATAGKPNDHLVAEPTSSEHPRGRAADIKRPGMTAVALFNLILGLYEAGELSQLGGVGLYTDFVHVDVRPRPGADGTATGGHLAIWGGSRPSNVA